MGAFVVAVDVNATWDGKLKLPWRPKAFILRCVTQPTDGYLSHANFAGYTGDGAISLGIATDDFQALVQTGSGPKVFSPFNDSGRGYLIGDRCITAAGRNAGLPGFTPFLSYDASHRCGAQFSLHQDDGSTWRVYFLALGGDDLQAGAGAITLDGGGADTDISGLDFDPSADPSLLYALASAPTTSSDEGLISEGFCDGTDQHAAGLDIHYNARGGNPLSAAAIDAISGATFAGWTSDGATISQPGAHGQQLLYLILSSASGAFKVGTGAWPSGSESKTGVGQKPEAVIVHGTVTGEQPTDGQFTVGLAGIGRSRPTPGPPAPGERAWNEVITASDATYDTGFVGMFLTVENDRVDDFAADDATHAGDTVPVLDDANRPDDTDPGPDWSSPLFGGLFGDTDLAIESNEFSGSADPGGGYWNGATFGPTSEVMVTIRNIDTGVWLASCVSAPGDFGGLFTGYVVIVGNTGLTLVRFDPGITFNPLGSFAASLVSGDKVKLRVDGGTVSVHIFHAADPPDPPPTNIVNLPAGLAGLAEEIGMNDTDNQRRWTAMRTLERLVALDYLGDAGTESGHIEIDSLDADGFSWTGVDSGFGGDVAWAAIATGTATPPNERCGRPQIFRRVT